MNYMTHQNYAFIILFVSFSFSSFLNNRAKDSAAFSTIFVHMLFEGDNVFNGNRGGAVQVYRNH